jgi:hypothetical protein
VVQKFNDTYNWKCEEFIDLKNEIKSIKKLEASEVLNTLRICDPAVGSGHFLVSALNEMISIKQDLKILIDKTGEDFSEYSIEIENDELIIKDEKGNPYSYNVSNKESRRIQETLFNEKQTIIENCLFGVDINPKSVMICRLRLWIELLKNAYYTESSKYKELETLPNIDINIKCGNSLISRFEVKDSVFESIPNFQQKLKDYTYWVSEYKNVKDKGAKTKLAEQILDFKNGFKHRDPRLVKIDKDIAKIVDEIDYKFPKNNIFGSQELTPEQNKIKDKLLARLEKITLERKDLESNRIYDNAFEWRFEFPEILDEKGGFIGFDVVIGNPPYGKTSEQNDIKQYFSDSYLTAEGKHELFKYFIEKSISLIKPKSYLIFITPDTWLQLGYFSKLRNLILNENTFISCTEPLLEVFEEATVDTIIFSIKKEKTSVQNILLTDKNLNKLDYIKPIGNVLYTKNIPDLIFKIESFSTNTFDDFTEIWQGLIAYGEKSQERIWTSNEQESEHHRKLLYGGDIAKYKIEWSGEYLKYGEWLHRPRPSYIFDNPKIIVQRIRNPQLKNRLISTLDADSYVNGTGLSNILIKENNLNITLDFLLGLINSKLINYWFKFYFTDVNIKPEQLRKIPISLSNNIQVKIEKLVHRILSLKKSNPETDTTDLEAEIDMLVYELYGLSEEEMAIIENK